MPEFEITSPEGKKFRVTAPEGATQEQVLEYAQSQFKKPEPASAPADPSEGELPLRPFGIDTGLTMPQGVSRFAAGGGKALSDIGTGLKQAGAEVMDYVAPRSQTLSGQIAPGTRGDALRRQTDEERALSAPLMKTGAGMAGNLAGNVAAFAPTAFIPGANTYTGAALTGAALGALAPVGADDNRAANAALGAGAGVAGQAVGRGLGRALRPVASKLGPEEQALAAAAGREGVPITAGQATGSRPLQVAESVMENMPLTSASQLAGKEAQQRAFTAAALRRAGISGDSAAAPALLAQKNALGSQIGDIAERGALDFNRGLTDRLADVVDDAAKRLPPADAAKVAGTVDQILAQVEQRGAMRGSNYQGWREPLRALASEGGATGRIYANIRKALDAEFRGQLSGADRTVVEDASRKYANVKTIIDAMGGAGSAPAKGQISPAQLSAALGRSMGREGKALGRGDLNELARVGQLFVKDQIPNSGTAQRQLIQSLMTGNVPGAAAGAGLGYYEGRTPEAALLGAGVGMAGTMALPKLAQALMNSGAGQQYLKQGAVALTEGQRAALSNMLRLGALGGAQQMATQ